jgi:hypothetical protein
MGVMRTAYKILVGNPEGKKPPGRPRRRWKDNFKANFKEIVCEDMDWIHLAERKDQWRSVVIMVMKLQVRK